MVFVTERLGLEHDVEAGSGDDALGRREEVGDGVGVDAVRDVGLCGHEDLRVRVEVAGVGDELFDLVPWAGVDDERGAILWSAAAEPPL